VLPALLMAGVNDDASTCHGDGAIIYKGAAATTEILLLPAENTTYAPTLNVACIILTIQISNTRAPDDNVAAAKSS